MQKSLFGDGGCVLSRNSAGIPGVRIPKPLVHDEARLSPLDISFLFVIGLLEQLEKFLMEQRGHEVLPRAASVPATKKRKRIASPLSPSIYSIEADIVHGPSQHNLARAENPYLNADLDIDGISLATTDSFSHEQERSLLQDDILGSCPSVNEPKYQVRFHEVPIVEDPWDRQFNRPELQTVSLQQYVPEAFRPPSFESASSLNQSLQTEVHPNLGVASTRMCRSITAPLRSDSSSSFMMAAARSNDHPRMPFPSSALHSAVPTTVLKYAIRQTSSTRVDHQQFGTSVSLQSNEPIQSIHWSSKQETKGPKQRQT